MASTPHLGVRETSPAFTGERKSVSVLFSDLSGFTALSEQADPEVVRALLVRLLSEADQVVAEYGGHVEQFQCDAPPISESSLLLMSTHPWTGNIRELENLTKRYVVVGTEDAILSEIGQRSLVPGYSAVEPDASISLGQMTRTALREMEGRIILNALHANQWNRKRTARALKISYRSLLYKVKKAGIQNRRGPGVAGAEKNKWEKLS